MKTRWNEKLLQAPAREAGGDVEDQALAWVMRLSSGAADPAMQWEFEHWRRVDPAHEAALARARTLWLQLGPVLQDRYDPVAVRTRARNPRRRRRLLALAAAVLLALGVGRQWMSDWRHDQVTAVGEQRTVALADGSTMWLNTGSAADVAIGPRGRHVDLVRGEAFFDVRRDRRRVFTIDAGMGRVEVLGTAFAVHRDGADVVVTVQRGRVQVSGGGTPAVELTPNQQVRVHAGDAVKHIERVDADDLLSWRTGQLVFIDRPLSEILAELKRYDARVQMVQYPPAARVRMSARIDLARLDAWYDGLQQSLPVKVTRIGPLVWIRARNIGGPGA